MADSGNDISNFYISEEFQNNLAEAHLDDFLATFDDSFGIHPENESTSTFDLPYSDAAKFKELVDDIESMQNLTSKNIIMGIDETLEWNKQQNLKFTQHYGLQSKQLMIDSTSKSTMSQCQECGTSVPYSCPNCKEMFFNCCNDMEQHRQLCVPQAASNYLDSNNTTNELSAQLDITKNMQTEDGTFQNYSNCNFPDISDITMHLNAEDNMQTMNLNVCAAQTMASIGTSITEAWNNYLDSNSNTVSGVSSNLNVEENTQTICVPQTISIEPSNTEAWHNYPQCEYEKSCQTSVPENTAESMSPKDDTDGKRPQRTHFFEKDGYTIEKTLIDYSAEVRRYCSQCDKHVVGNRSTDKSCQKCYSPLLFQCAKCNSNYKTYGTIAYHLQVKCYPSQYRCKDCSFNTTLKQSMLAHFRLKHTGKDKFHCQFCDFKTMSETSLVTHRIVRHYSDEGFVCKTCWKLFSKEWQYKEHMTMKHQQNFKCEICWRYSTHIKSRLDKHVQRKHS